MFAALARILIARRRVIVGAYLFALPFAALFGGSVLFKLKAGGFEDPAKESWQAFAVVQRELGAGTGDILALYTSPNASVEEPEVMGDLLAVVGTLEADADVGAVTSYWSTGAPHFVSRDKHQTFLVVDLRGDEQHKTEAYRRLAPALAIPGLTLQLGGLIPTDTAVFETIQRDLTRGELLAFPLMALIVLLVFGSLASVGVMCAIGGFAIVLAFAALRAIVAFMDVSVFALNTVTILGLGLAVDYSLFLVNRFREELPARGVEGALVRTMETTGRAVLFSGVTVAASLCGLFAFEQMMLRSLAVGGVVVVLLTVVLALTLVPAVLAMLGPRIDAWRVPGLGGAPPSGDNLWHRVAARATKRPVIVAIAVAALLLSLATPFLRFQGSIVDYRLLPRGDPVRETHAVLDAQFIANMSTPHVVLVTMASDVMTRANLEQLAALSDRLAHTDGVARVDGLFSFVAGVDSARVIDALLKRDAHDALSEKLFASFAKGPWMRFSVLSQHPFDDARSLATVARIRALSTPDVRVQVAGYSAALLDLKSAVRERAPIMVLAVFAVMFVILFLMFGSVTLPLKAMVMNLLSLTASFGAIVWLFQDGRLQSLLGFESLGSSDSTQPLVMFAIVFGLSMDYEVLILARIREEYLRTGDNTRAIAEGLGRTGRLITSAAALLVVVVGAFSTSSIVYMKALGVGMALAIALDATIVRALLVPATMQLLGTWNWYAPAFLVRAWKRTGLSDQPH